MKKTVQLSAILSLLAAACLLWLGAGCATTGLDAGTKDAARSKAKAAVASLDIAEAAVVAAAASSGDYKAAYDGLIKYAKRVKSAETKAKVAGISREQVAAVMRADGYDFVKTVFFDGVVVNQLKRISWESKWVKLGTGEDAGIEEIVAVDSGTGADLDEADEEGGIDWASVIIGTAEENGIAVDN